ncbi:MAG: D-glycero-beta-D-manno-heptose 1,7-bisphosphate 7-phosphatase, partial [Gammaproteobacteria bacterium]
MKLIILDRDGVINYDSPDYIKSPAEWRPIPGSLEAIAKLNNAGYKVVVATNQSGIGRGLFNLHTLHAIHKHLKESLAKVGGHIDFFAVCPHTPDDNCSCRKPRPGLLLQISQRYNCSLQDVPVIGDSFRDIKAAVAVGARPILVLTGNGVKAKIDLKPEHKVMIYKDLLEVANQLTK